MNGLYTHGMPVFGFERVCIGVEGKAGMRRSSRTTASISNAAIRVKARAMEAENRCAMGIQPCSCYSSARVSIC